MVPGVRDGLVIIAEHTRHTTTADLLHGPIATVYAGAPVLLIEGGGPADTDLADLRDLLTARGAEQAGLPLPPTERHVAFENWYLP